MSHSASDWRVKEFWTLSFRGVNITHAGIFRTQTLFIQVDWKVDETEKGTWRVLFPLSSLVFLNWHWRGYKDINRDYEYFSFWWVISFAIIPFFLEKKLPPQKIMYGSNRSSPFHSWQVPILSQITLFLIDFLWLWSENQSIMCLKHLNKCDTV